MSHLTYDDFRTQLDDLLQHRAEVYPVRDAQYSRLVEFVGEFAQWLMHNVPSDWQPDASKLETAQALQPIFVGGYRKSGTTLFLNLLDGHPEISVLPAGDARLLAFAEKVAGLDEQEAIYRQVKKWLHIAIVGSGLPPYWLFGEEPTAYFDLATYIPYWMKNTADPSHRHIEAIAKAFTCANPLVGSGCRFWLDKTPLQELQIDRLVELYPHMRFVHVVRNPLATLAAVERINTDRDWGFSLGRDTNELKSSMQKGLENAKRLGKDRYLIVHYEDFVLMPEDTMQQVAEWLGIGYHESLLQPTVNGIPSVSNSAFKENRLEGEIHARSLDRWRQSLTTYEVKHIQQTLYDEARAYGYSHDDLRVSATFPMQLKAKKLVRGVRKWITST